MLKWLPIPQGNRSSNLFGFPNSFCGLPNGQAANQQRPFLLQAVVQWERLFRSVPAPAWGF